MISGFASAASLNQRIRISGFESAASLESADSCYRVNFQVSDLFILMSVNSGLYQSKNV